ncbi:MAG: hypothetical protein V3V08_19355 [Nannocystaceae bacterium]
MSQQSEIPHPSFAVPSVIKVVMIGSVLASGAAAMCLPVEGARYLVRLLASEPGGPAFMVALSFSSLLMIAVGWLVPRLGEERVAAVVRRAMSGGGTREEALRRCLAPLLLFFILRLSCFESVALFGLLVSMGTGEPYWWVLLASLALLNMLLARFPRERVQRAWSVAAR